MNILAIAACSGRHKHVENLLRMYLLQDYTGGDTILLIYNNSGVEQKIDWENIDLKPNQHIVLVNQGFNPHTKQSFSSLGEIFNCILSYIRENIDPVWMKEALINHMHVDDLYLPHHFSNGVRGYYEGKIKGFDTYKPKYSYFLAGDDLQLQENYMEPSIFLHWEVLQKAGYIDGSNAAYDMSWYNAAKIYMDEASPSLIYCWGNGVYKISGDDKNPNNFQNARKSDVDEGDLLISPSSKEDINPIYNKLCLKQE